ncbi:MAG TPA: SUMF1/EgtB/PvdO family nonheme iron enzyme, partial [Longimicrobiaceae bacterium]|nr:SUMF1/EgtB/PvdO family nonheme iron enzyme [Longimicrobiaceae bacterium]
WELGTFPDGEADLPVSGISWFEAVAYARFREKQLPTVYHWARAALSGFPGAFIVPPSNFGSRGPAIPGTHAGLGPYGTYDTAGNVREWCWNAQGDRRWILGGSWTDPDYMATQPLQIDPFDRSAVNGLRLMRLLEGQALPGDLAAPVTIGVADRRGAQPVADPIFEVFRSQYVYPDLPLAPSVELEDTGAEGWTRQVVTVELSYTADRLPINIFLPKGADPPYQAVIFISGSGSFDTQRNTITAPSPVVDFLPSAGRALIMPVYEGSYQRWDGFLDLQGEQYQIAFREHMIHWREDLGRTIDYLETRSDIDPERIAYMGFSFGASTILPPAALEERLTTFVLISGGLTPRELTPIADMVNYVSRLTRPVLMLNGEFDPLFPVETLQRPLFELLGAQPDQKAHLTFPTGHTALPRGFRIRHTLDWLDRHLGPVQGD